VPTTGRHPLRYLKRVVEPQGRVQALDTISLLLWEGYALARGVATALGSVRRRTHGEQGHEIPDAEASLYRRASFYREHVFGSILPFWEKYAVDRQYGGFRTHLDRAGRLYQEEAEKTTHMHARMTYTFSAAHNVEPRAGYLEMARQGFGFLRTHLWDERFGGWYRSVRRDGAPCRTEKYSFDHACALLALLEFYRASGDRSALEYLCRTDELLDRHARDRRYLGYYESFQRDWTVRSRKKTLSAHLELLLATLALSHWERGAARGPGLTSVARLISSRMRDRKHGCALETFYQDWLYNPVATRDRVRMGHNLKAAWLLLETYRSTHDEGLFESAKELIGFCLKHGWDARHQGFFDYVFRSGVVAAREKVSHTQSECLPGLLLMYTCSRDPVYLEYFTRLAAFCNRYFADPRHGEWFASCDADGTAKDSNKGGTWKGPFHPALEFLYVARYLAADRIEG
jgi:mannobiose 2-epimerase